MILINKIIRFLLNLINIKYVFLYISLIKQIKKYIFSIFNI